MTGNPIAFLGGSFVESTFCNELERFVSQVERKLRVPCYNAGYSGSTTLHLTNSLINKVFPAIGPKGTPVLFVGQSDADYLGDADTYWSANRRGTPIVPANQGNASLPVGLEATRIVVKLIISSAQSLGLKPIVAISPFSTPDFSTDASIRAKYRRNRETYERVLQRRIGIAAMASEIAHESSVSLIDGHSFMSGNVEFFYDELHLNHFGQKVFSEFLSKELSHLLSLQLSD